MGISSSLLDETKSNFIKGQAEADLKEFSPYYRKQFSVARFAQVEDDLEPHKEKITQLLKQREAPEEGEVLYEEGVFYFDDTRKWRERYVVVRANYCLECHDGLETFVKGVPPRHKLLPTGGTVLTTEEMYMAMVDKCFPDDTSVKEDFAPPLSGMPGQFPVYLRLPYRRDSYFCFKQQAKQAAFISILSDCIRHQNQDFLKKRTCEVQAFLKAIQLCRQDKGKYEAWDMLIGSDVRVMANLVMEQLLPSLEKDMLPRLKAKKTEKKRVWFATVEAAYILVQEHLLEALTALKAECRMSVRQQEVLIHSDMDQILDSRRQLEDKVRAKVSEPAEKLCSESVQPYLGSVLEELMEPISSGFQEGRQLSEAMMDQVCQDVLQTVDNEQLKKVLSDISRPNLLSCYQKISSLQDKLQQLQERFGFSNITGVIHSAQIDLQQLMQNAAYTFEQLLYKAVQDNPDNAGSAIEKAKHRVLKQYDYDSSTVRKRISRETLVSITLPFLKKNLAPTCKTELQGLDQSVYADYSSFIHVENVYEDILLQTLDKEVTKVVKEAASLKKYNLFTDSRDLLSQSSRSSLSSSTPSSPAMVLASPVKTFSEPQPPSPLSVNGLSSSPQEQPEKENGALHSEASTDVTVIQTPLGKVEQKEAAQSVKASQEAELQPPKAEEVIVEAEAGSPVALEITETPKVNTEATPETEIQEEAISVKAEEAEPAAEPQTLSADAPREAETPSESLKTDGEAAAAQTEVPAPGPDPVNEPPAPGPDPVNEPPAPGPDTVSEPPAPGPDTVSEPPAPGPDPVNEPPAPGPDPVSEPPAPGPDTVSEPPAPGPDPVNEPPAPGPDPVSEPPAPGPDPVTEPVNTSVEGTGSQTGDSSEDNTHCGSSEVELEAPSCGETPVLTPPDPNLGLESGNTKADSNSLDVSVGSESAPSDVGSMEDIKATQSSEDEVSTTSDILEDEANISKSPVSSDDPGEDKTPGDEPSPQAQSDAVSGGVGVGGDIEAGASVEASDEAADMRTSPSSEPTNEETPTAPESPPPDSIKEIRDLVVEVIEVEELVHRYPSGIPKEE